jgi:hypothetical protein
MRDEALLPHIVFDFVSSRTELDCLHESLPAERSALPCVSVQTLTGTPVERTYKDGSYIGNYRFAVYLRQTTEDNAGRLDGSRIMADLTAAIDKATVELPSPFSFWGLELDTLPVKVDSEPAFDDWQATFTMRYKKG